MARLTEVKPGHDAYPKIETDIDIAFLYDGWLIVKWTAANSIWSVKKHVGGEDWESTIFDHFSRAKAYIDRVRKANYQTPERMALREAFDAYRRSSSDRRYEVLVEAVNAAVAVGDELDDPSKLDRGETHFNLLGPRKTFDGNCVLLAFWRGQNGVHYNDAVPIRAELVQWKESA